MMFDMSTSGECEMKYYRAIFDLDGTLLDTSEGIFEAVKHTIKVMGYKSLSDDEILDFIGPPIQNSLMSHLGISNEKSQIGANIFRDYYKSTSLLLAKPYEGIYKLLEQLKLNGIQMAVATYKREDYAIQLLDEFKLSDYFSIIHGADNNNMMEKKDIIDLCNTELGNTNEKIVYIGDTMGDYLAAEKCGIDFIGVTYGFGFKKNNIQKYSLANNCEDLKNYLL